MNKETSLINIAKKESGAVKKDNKTSSKQKKESTSIAGISDSKPVSLALINSISKNIIPSNIKGDYQIVSADEGGSLEQSMNVKIVALNKDQVQIMLTLAFLAVDDITREFKKEIVFKELDIAKKLNNTERQKPKLMSEISKNLYAINAITYPYKIHEEKTGRETIVTARFFDAFNKNSDGFFTILLSGIFNNERFSYVDVDVIKKIKEFSSSGKSMTDSLFSLLLKTLGMTNGNSVKLKFDLLLESLYPNLFKERHYKKAEIRFEKEIAMLAKCGLVVDYKIDTNKYNERIIRIKHNYIKRNKGRQQAWKQIKHEERKKDLDKTRDLLAENSTVTNETPVHEKIDRAVKSAIEELESSDIEITPVRKRLLEEAATLEENDLPGFSDAVEKFIMLRKKGYNYKFENVFNLLKNKEDYLAVKEHQLSSCGRMKMKLNKGNSEPQAIDTNESPREEREAVYNKRDALVLKLQTDQSVMVESERKSIEAQRDIVMQEMLSCGTGASRDMTYYHWLQDTLNNLDKDTRKAWHQPRSIPVATNEADPEQDAQKTDHRETFDDGIPF